MGRQNYIQRRELAEQQRFVRKKQQEFDERVRRAARENPDLQKGELAERFGIGYAKLSRILTGPRVRG